MILKIFVVVCEAVLERLYNTLKMVLWYFAYGIETMWLNIMFT